MGQYTTKQKQFIAGLKSDVARADSNAKYWESAANRASERLAQERTSNNATLGNIHADYQRQIAALQDRFAELEFRKNNEDTRIDRLMNSVVQTAIATAQGRRA